MAFVDKPKGTEKVHLTYWMSLMLQCDWLSRVVWSIQFAVTG